MLLKGNATAKYEFIKEKLLKAIENGELKPGEKLPGERELAAHFEVSYMTARKSVTELIKKGVIERRNRRGTYVASKQADKRPQKIKVCLICPSSESDIITNFIYTSQKHITENGWDSQVIMVSEENQDAAVKEIKKGTPILMMLHQIYPLQKIRSAIEQYPDHIVVLGSSLAHLGIASVQCDDGYAVNLAMEHLMIHGHKNIGFALHYPELKNGKIRIAVWRSCFNQSNVENLNKRLILFDIEPFKNQAEFAFKACSKFLANGNVDLSAILCLNNETAIGVMAAIHQHGLKVPDDISIVALGDSSIVKFANPSITSVDYNFEQEIRNGFDMLYDAILGKLPDWDRIRLTRPTLIERNSVKHQN